MRVHSVRVNQWQVQSARVKLTEEILARIVNLFVCMFFNALFIVRFPPFIRGPSLTKKKICGPSFLVPLNWFELISLKAELNRPSITGWALRAELNRPSLIDWALVLDRSCRWIKFLSNKEKMRFKRYITFIMSETNKESICFFLFLSILG